MKSFRAALALVAVAAASVAPAAAGPTPPPWIAFVAAPQHGTLPEQLFRVRADGTGLMQITRGVNVATEPSFSPSGRKIVFARLSSGLFVMNGDGSHLHRLTSGRDDLFPVWSPEGKQIAFLRPEANELHLYVMSANGRGQRLLRRAPVPASRPSWTPDGNIVIGANGALFKVSSLSGRVISNVGVAIDAENSVAVPTLDPNGRFVAYVGPRPAPAGCERAACEVYALYIKQLAANERQVPDAGPAGWSGDSRRLAFAHGGALALQAVNGAGATTIGTGSSAIAGDSPPAWQPR